MKRRVPEVVFPIAPLAAVCFCLVLAGCGPRTEEASEHSKDKPGTAAPHSHDHHDEGGEDSHEGHSHAHTAPHGGTLIVLGDHFAFLELVLDVAVGKMTAYVLDGEAEKPVRVAQTTLEILILKPESPATGPPVGDLLKLDAVANSLTGETAGDTSEFTVTSDLLRGKAHFNGVIQSLSIKGEEKKGIAFDFPEGNE